MERAAAVKILKESLQEISRLKQLPYGNREYTLWKTRLEENIKTGLEEGDLAVLEETGLPVFIVNNYTTAAARQSHYISLLDAYNLNIEKIIQKYESVKIENNRPSPKALSPAFIYPMERKAGFFLKSSSFSPPLISNPW